MFVLYFLIFLDSTKNNCPAFFRRVRMCEKNRVEISACLGKIGKGIGGKLNFLLQTASPDASSSVERRYRKENKEFVPGTGIEPVLAFSANRILSPACLPIPPPRQSVEKGLKNPPPKRREKKSVHQSERKMSGRRDSNPRPSPWQGDALPAELLPHFKSHF